MIADREVDLRNAEGREEGADDEDSRKEKSGR